MSDLGGIDTANSDLSPMRQPSRFHIARLLGRRVGNSSTVIQLRSELSFSRNYSAWKLIAIAASITALALFYAWNASLPSSSIRALMFPDPQTTVFVINILSHIAVLFLGDLIATACENLRWTLCSHRGGVTMLNFLALGSSTSVFGLFQLLFVPRLKENTEPRKQFIVRHALSVRLWPAQRFALYL
jgi:hypothetical protein